MRAPEARQFAELFLKPAFSTYRTRLERLLLRSTRPPDTFQAERLWRSFQCESLLPPPTPPPTPPPARYLRAADRAWLRASCSVRRLSLRRKPSVNLPWRGHRPTRRCRTSRILSCGGIGMID